MMPYIFRRVISKTGVCCTMWTRHGHSVNCVKFQYVSEFSVVGRITAWKINLKRVTMPSKECASKHIPLNTGAPFCLRKYKNFKNTKLVPWHIMPWRTKLIRMQCCEALDIGILIYCWLASNPARKLN
jgi:hypothetical protein